MSIQDDNAKEVPLIERLRLVPVAAKLNIEWGTGHLPAMTSHAVGRLCHDAADRIEQLEAELAEARKDAERYRWLRNDCPQTMCRELFGIEGSEDELDKAIDEAIEAEMAGAAIDKAMKQETP